MTSTNLYLIQSIEREARILNHLADKLEGIVNDPEFMAGCTIMSVKPEDATNSTQGVGVRAKAFRLHVAMPLVSRLRRHAEDMVGAIHAPHEGDRREWLTAKHEEIMSELNEFLPMTRDVVRAVRDGRSILKEIQGA
jgi:hypothetical protein